MASQLQLAIHSLLQFVFMPIRYIWKLLLQLDGLLYIDSLEWSLEQANSFAFSLLGYDTSFIST